MSILCKSVRDYANNSVTVVSKFKITPISSGGTLEFQITKQNHIRFKIIMFSHPM